MPSWWEDIQNWWDGEEAAPVPVAPVQNVDQESQRAQQLAKRYIAAATAKPAGLPLAPVSNTPLLDARKQWNEPAKPLTTAELMSQSLDRPDTGALDFTGQQQQAPTYTTPTMPFDPYAPKTEAQAGRGWGVMRWAGDAVGDAVSPFLNIGQNAVDAAKGAIGPLPEQGVAAPDQKWGIFGEQNPENKDSFWNTAASDRMLYDMGIRQEGKDAWSSQAWGEWANNAGANIGGALSELGQIPGAVAQNNQLIRDEFGQLVGGEQGIGQALGDYWQGMSLDGVAALPKAAFAAGQSLVDTNGLTRGIAQGAMNVASGMQAAQDWMNTQPLPGNNMPLGTAIGSVYEAITDPALQSQILESTVGGDKDGVTLWEKAKQSYFDAQNRYALAITPTAEQLQNMDPADIQKAQGRALLNWADPAAVAKTFDALVDQGGTVANLTAEAKRLFDAGTAALDEDEQTALWSQAADLGAEAYKLENTHPIALVNENTNIWRQLAFEVMQPDITDLFGGVVSVFGGGVRGRRLSAVAGEVLENSADEAANILGDLAIGPQTKAAMMAEKSTYNPRNLLNVWSTGQSQAHIATDKLHRFVANVMGDVDTADDARLLLHQLATDPAKLITGMNANLFQSPGLLARADSAGLVRFGSMNLENIKEPVRIFQQVADEFLGQASSLAQGPVLNKVDFAVELTDAMNTAGYRFYNVANELGQAPLGTVTTRLKSTTGNQYMVEYLDAGKNVVKTSEPMLLQDARKLQTDITKAADKGTTAQQSALSFVGANLRKAVSPFYIYLSPGTWATNIIGGTATAVGDGTMAGGRVDNLRGHLAKLYGVDPTVRGLEGVENSMNMASTGAGGILAPLKKAYSSIEENMGTRVYYKSVTHALQKTGKNLLRNAVAPILQNAGVTDAREIKRITDHLFDVGYSGGNLVDEFNKIINGRTRVFSLSGVNPQWIDALGADGLESFYNIIRTAPDKPTAITQLQGWIDTVSKQWDQMIQEAPTVPARQVWQKQETAQDVADLSQVGKMAQKYGGIPEADVVAWKQAAAASMTEADRKMQTLMQVVAEAGDPANRYVLYDIWGNISDMTANVRAQLSELAEQASSAPLQQRPQAWGDYWTQARELWDNRNLKVNELLEQSAATIAAGQEVAPNIRQWDILERTAKVSEQSLWDTLRLEPGSGAYDQRLQQVIDAGRTISDKAVARAYAAARRFPEVDAMDYIISAEKNVQMAGAQARAYLDDVLERISKSGKWQEYFQIRNETWRQLRQYERDVWGGATHSIVRDGVGVTKSTGLKFDSGFDGVVELVGPETSVVRNVDKRSRAANINERTVTNWIVKREDGTVTTVPDKLVPPEIKQQYAGVTPAQVDEEIALELDNIASAQPYAEDAAEILDAPTPPIRFQAEAQPGVKGIYRKGGKDVEVTILGPGEGSNYRYQLPDGTIDDAPRANLLIRDQKGTARSLDTIEQQRQADRAAQAIDQTAAKEQGATAARDDMRAQWDRIAGGELGLPSIDNLILRYVRNGTANVPENMFEDLYGRVIGGRTINNQDDVNNLLLEFSDLSGVKAASRKERKAIKQGIARQTVASRTGLDQMFDGSGGAISENLRATWRRSVERTGQLPDQEAQSLLGQIYKRMLADGKPATASTLDEAIGLVEEAGGNAAAATTLYSKRRPKGAPVATPKEMAAAKLPELDPALQAKYDEFLAGYEQGEAMRLEDWRHFFDDAEWPKIETQLQEEATRGRVKILPDREPLPDAPAAAPPPVQGRSTPGLVNADDVKRRWTSYLNGQPDTTRIRLASFRDQFTDEEWRVVQQQMRQDALDDKLVLMPIDDPKEIEDIDRAAAFVFGGDSRMIVYRKGWLSSTLPDIGLPDNLSMSAGMIPLPTKQLKALVDRVKKELNLGNGANHVDLQKVADLTTKNTTAAGGTQFAEQALGAMFAKDQLQNVYDYVINNLDEIMKPTGALGSGQNLRALDEFRRTAIPAWDNAKYVASEYANRMRSFTMVDFQNNTRLDELAGLVLPYGFWFSRSIKNSLERAVFEPHVWKRVMQTEREIADMQEQRGDPARYQGSIPIDMGNGTVYYLRISPAKYWPTFGMFTQNDYADPESANNAFTFAVESMSATNAAPFPWIKAASQMYSNSLEGKPLSDDIYPASYIPQGRLIGWAATKVMGPNLPWVLRPGYYEYNVARELTTMVSEKKITAQQAQWAQDILRQMRSGEEPLPEQAAMADQLMTILEEAVKRAADKELLAAGTSYTTGMGVRPYDQDEAKAMEASQKYNQREFNVVTNPFGGETAQSATFEQYPELSPKFSQSSVYNLDSQRPGASAALSSSIAETTAARDTLYGAGNAAVDALLAANPQATKNEIYQARNAGILQAAAAEYGDVAAAYIQANPEANYTAVIKHITDSIEAKWPSADLVKSSDKPKDYNVPEQKQNFQEGVLKQAELKFPYPPGEYPEGGTPEQIKAYMAARAAVDARRKEWTAKALMSGQTEDRYRLLQDETMGINAEPNLGATPEEAQALMQGNATQYQTEAEKKRLAEIATDNAQYGPDGYDKDGYNKWGYDRNDTYNEAYDRDDTNKKEGSGYDPETGYNKWGWDQNDNYNPEYDTVGDKYYGKKGGGSSNYDPETGYNKWGYNKDDVYNADYDTVGGKRGSSQGAQDYKAARQGVVDRFGDEGGALWDQYYDLPSGSEERRAFAAANPAIKLYNLYGYNKDMAEAGMAAVGVDGALQWAHAPAYSDTPEAKAARSAYWDANPKAYEFNAWINGRPTAADDSSKEPNGGKDYETAKQMFGADIWGIVGTYKRGWDGTQKRLYFEKYPQLSQFFEWWNGNLPKTAGAAAGGARSGGGGGGGGFGGGYSQAPERRTQVQIQDVYGQGLTRGLAEQPQIKGYSPNRLDTSWMNAGRELRPDPARAWSPSWIRGIKT